MPIFSRMKRGGHKARKIDLDGYEKKAACQERQVTAKARMSMEEVSIPTIECSKASGRSTQPWKVDTSWCLEPEPTHSLLGLFMTRYSLQNIIKIQGWNIRKMSRQRDAKKEADSLLELNISIYTPIYCCKYLINNYKVPNITSYIKEPVIQVCKYGVSIYRGIVKTAIMKQNNINSARSREEPLSAMGRNS